MLCSNCGTNIENNEKFCPRCGTPVTEQPSALKKEPITTPSAVTETPHAVENPTEPVSAVSTPVPAVTETQTEEPKKTKKKGSKKGKIILWSCIAAVVAAIVLIVALNFSYIANFFNKMFSSDDDYIKTVYQNSANEFADEFEKNYDIYLKSLGADSAASGEMTIDISDEATSLIGSYIETDIDWINSIDISLETNVKGKNTSVVYALSLNGVKILTGDVVATDKATYVKINEMFTKHLMTPIDLDEADFADVTKKLPDAKTAKEMIKRYSSILIENISEVEKESDTVKVSGINVKCDKYTIEVDEKLFNKIVSELSKEAKKDKDLKKLFPDMDDSIEFEEDEFTKFKYSTWINEAGKIIGFEIDMGEEGLISYTAAESGKKSAFDLIISDAEFAVELSGDGVASNDKFNGEYELKVNKANVAEVVIKDLDLKELEKGFIKCKVEINPNKSIMSSIVAPLLENEGVDEDLIKLLTGLKLEFDYAQSDKNGKVVFTVLSNDKEFLKITTNGSTKTPEDVEVPKDAVESDKIESIIAPFKILGILSSLEEAGVPSELITELLQNVN